MSQDLSAKDVEPKMELITGDIDVERKGSAGPVGNLMLLKAKHSLHAPFTQVLRFYYLNLFYISIKLVGILNRQIEDL